MKFNCKKCGKCCRIFNSKGGGTLPLFYEEKKRFEILLENLKLKGRFIAENILFDKISGKLFCLNWGLCTEPCIFLGEEGCVIYEQRALICKAFPVGSEIINRDTAMSCDSVNLKEVGSVRYFNKETINARREIEKRKVDFFEKLEKEGEIKIKVVGDWIDAKNNYKKIIDVEEFFIYCLRNRFKM